MLDSEKFDLGDIVTTSGIVKKMKNSDKFQTEVQSSLRKHSCGDWGILNDYDKVQNDESVKYDLKFDLISAYMIGKDQIYIITQSNPRLTTILLSSEY